MDEWFRRKGAGWFAYVPAMVLEKVANDPACHDAILTASGTHKAASVRAMDSGTKRLAVKALVDARRNDAGQYHGLDPLEVLALLTRQAVPKMKKPAKHLQCFWPAVPQGRGKGEGEKELLAPVVHFRSRGYEVYREIETGRNRADAVCHKMKAGWSPEELIAIELKNDLGELRHAMDQLTTFAQYVHRTYLACTPALAFDFLERHASARGVHRWDPKALENKLSRAKIGLLLVWNDQVRDVLEAPASRLLEDKRAEIGALLVAKNLAPKPGS